MRWENINKLTPDFDDMIKRQWSELSDDQVRIVAGRRALLLDSLQESYGLSRELAENEVDEWVATFGDIDDDAEADHLAVDLGHGCEVSFVEDRAVW